MASSVGSMILNLVMKEVFGNDDTQRLIEAVKQVIKDEIESSDMTKIEGTIEGTLQFLTVEYKHQKAKSDLNNVEHRKALMRDMKSYSNRFYTDVIGTLKQSKYAIHGLKTFAFGASVHLLMTQEMATIDPDFMDPNESGYLLTLRDNAKIYRSHVKSYYDKAMNDRNHMHVYSEDVHQCPATGHCHTITQWGWRDQASGESRLGFTASKKPRRTAEENASIDLEKHRNKVLDQLRHDLGDPKNNFLAQIGSLEKFKFPKS